MKNEIPNKAVSGTGEWAAKNINILNGCGHNCKYCYACSMAIRFKRKTAENWSTEKVRENALNISIKKVDGQIMFPSSHDISPDHLPESLIVIGKILSTRNDILIVSKPHLECIKAICNEFEKYKDKILFRFSIGSTDNEVLKFWELNAPPYQERLKCLKYAYKNGFKTSVSAEPMLDGKPEKLYEQLSPYITDAIWFGKLNKVNNYLKLNGFGDEETLCRADALTDWQSNNDNILKLYNMFKNNPKVKWKDSIKKVVGLEISIYKGTDL